MAPTPASQHQAAVQPCRLPACSPADPTQHGPLLTVSPLGRECLFPRRQHGARPPPRRPRTAPPHLPPGRGRSSPCPLASCCPGPPLLLQAHDTELERGLFRHALVRALHPPTPGLPLLLQELTTFQPSIGQIRRIVLACTDSASRGVGGPLLDCFWQHTPRLRGSPGSCIKQHSQCNSTWPTEVGVVSALTSIPVHNLPLASHSGSCSEA